MSSRAKINYVNAQLVHALGKRPRNRYLDHPWCGRMKDRSAPSLLLQLPKELLAQIARELDTKSAQNLAVVCRALTGIAKVRLWRWLDLSLERDRGDPPDLSEDRDAYRAKVEQTLAEQREALKGRLQAVIVQGGEWWPVVDHFCTVLRAGCDAAVGDVLSRTAPTLRSLEIRMSFDEDYPSVRAMRARVNREEKLLLRMEDILASKTALSFPSLTHVNLARNTLHPDTVILLCQLAPNLTSLQFWAREFSRSAFGQHDGQPDPAPRRLTQNTKLRQLRIEYSAVLSLRGRPRAIESVLSLLAFSPRLEQVSLTVDANEHSPRFAERISAFENLRDIYWREIPSPGHSRRREVPHVDLPGSSSSLRRLILGYDMQKWQFPTAGVDDTLSLPMLEVAVISCDRWDASSSQNAAFPPPAPVQPLKPGFARWLEARPALHSMYFQPELSHDDTLKVFREVDAIEARKKPNGRIQSLVHGQEELLIVRLLLHDITVAKKRDGKKVKVKRRVVYTPDKWRYFASKKRAERAWQVFTWYKGAMVPMDVVKRVQAAEGSGKAWNARGVEVGEAAWAILREWREGVPDSDMEDEADLALSEDDWISGEDGDV